MGKTEKVSATKSAESNALALTPEQQAVLFQPEDDGGMDIERPRLRFNRIKVLSSDKQFKQFGVVDIKKEAPRVAELVAKYGSLYIANPENRGSMGLADLMDKYSGILLKVEKGCEVWEKAMIKDSNGSMREGWRYVAKFKFNLKKDQKLALAKAYQELPEDETRITDRSLLTEDVVLNTKKAKEVGFQITNQINLILAPLDYESALKSLKEGESPFVRLVIQGNSYDTWFPMPARMQKRLRESEVYPNVPVDKAKAPWFTIHAFGEESEHEEYGTMYKIGLNCEMSSPEIANAYLPMYQELKDYSSYDWQFDTHSVTLFRAIESEVSELATKGEGYETASEPQSEEDEEMNPDEVAEAIARDDAKEEKELNFPSSAKTRAKQKAEEERAEGAGEEASEDEDDLPF